MRPAARRCGGAWLPGGSLDLVLRLGGRGLPALLACGAAADRGGLRRGGRVLARSASSAAVLEAVPMDTTAPDVPTLASPVPVRHGAALPPELAGRIPESDARILVFLLTFLEAEGLSAVPVFVNGGYVRDLLLGKDPDDLDLSVCLRDCPPEVTVSGLLERLPAFAAARPQLGVAEVKVATILSNESKDKQLDTFKAHFIDAEGRKTEVDVMPTIGEETYGEDNRIPIRDQRGTPESDALRRDLTIGALLLRVALPPAGAGGGLRYELLDFHSGIEDLRSGLLRSPCPHDQPLQEVRRRVLRQPADERLASALGLDQLPERDAVQALWWAKVLMDDPLRICRALRFAVKLRFAMHASFWLAAPFALEHLRTKVAGSRKNTEYQKMAGYGFQPCLSFFEVAFGRTFGPKEELRLAPALFGGQDAKGKPKVMSEVAGFDLEVFGAVAQEYKSVKEEAELTGGLLAVAIAVAELAPGGGEPLEEFTRACDGMCVSNPMREAGTVLLQAVDRLAADPPAATRLDRGFASACQVSDGDFCLHVQVWEALQLCAPRAGPADAAAHRQRAALALLQRRAPAAAGRVTRAAEALAFQRPPVKGSVVCTPGVLEVPPQLRRQVMIFLEVSLRLLRLASPVETPEQLQALLVDQPGLGAALSGSVWFQDDGKTLREEFQPPKRGKK